ncbi:hypothetical protein AB1Y20_000870 [Prymnesium parvum]|uniref:20S-pre-rRNA D-site endonuclease NOB1 n=1 Tax=Prymnesium parvum TaxID=97485 RepID=A0AB34K989_PRYPA
MRWLVVDSGPLIKGVRLERIEAERYATVPEVMHEIRDRQARHLLSTLPVEIETREPSDEALAAVKAFARLTGDLHVLSAVDLRVLALTWMLQKEAGGVEHLRTVPIPRSANSALPRKTQSKAGARTEEGIAAATEEDGAAAMEREGEDASETDATEKDEAGEAAVESDQAAAAEAGEAAAESDQAATAIEAAEESPEVSLCVGGLELSERGEAEAVAAKAEARARALKEEENALAAALQAADGKEAPLDEDIPWITVENLKEAQAADAKYAAPVDASTVVGCTTTDYAMQSVLLQMGLKLISVEGMVMRSIKHWVMRCSGCFTVEQDLSKVFCSRCGNHSLVKLVSIVDHSGNTRLLPEAGAPARVRSTNIRGTKYSMPAPQTGRKANNLLLAEDQMAEAAEKLRRQGKKKTVDVLDADYDFEAHFGRKGKKTGPGGHGLTVGYGKKNVNDVRSRPKRT